MFGERELQSLGLARGGSRGRRQGRVDRLQRRARFDSEIELPFLAVAIAKRVHLREFLAGIDVQSGERYAAEKGLTRQPDHHVGIFAERPQQRQLLQPRECFPENVDALGLERFEVIHGGRMETHIGRNMLGRNPLGRISATQPRSGGILVEKMHLWPLAFAG
jgi:hypothetical protein